LYLSDAIFLILLNQNITPNQNPIPLIRAENFYILE